MLERGIRTLKEHLRTNLEEGYNINEALSRSLNAMSTTVHSSMKETPFERHYGRKPRTEIHNYLNMSPNEHYMVSARRRHYKSTHSPMGTELTINWY